MWDSLKITLLIVMTKAEINQFLWSLEWSRLEVTDGVF